MPNTSAASRTYAHEAAKFLFNPSPNFARLATCAWCTSASTRRPLARRARPPRRARARKGTHPAKGVPAGADLRASSSTPTSTASSTRTGRRRRHLQLRLVDCRHYHSRPRRVARAAAHRRAHRRRRHHTTATTIILATAATTIALALATVTAGEAAEPSPLRQIHRRCRRSPLPPSPSPRRRLYPALPKRSCIPINTLPGHQQTREL